MCIEQVRRLMSTSIIHVHVHVRTFVVQFQRNSHAVKSSIILAVVSPILISDVQYLYRTGNAYRY